MDEGREDDHRPAERPKDTKQGHVVIEIELESEASAGAATCPMVCVTARILVTGSPNQITSSELWLSRPRRSRILRRSIQWHTRKLRLVVHRPNGQTSATILLTHWSNA